MINKKYSNIIQDGIGYIELQDVMGSDIAIVQAARVSYLGENKSLESDKKLLFYLWRNRHSSPFEMAEIKLRVHCPLFVARQWMRHRAISYNEVSRRYTSEKIEFYYPKNWRMQDKVNKQGSDLIYSEDDNSAFDEVLRQLVSLSLDTYNMMIDNNIAREMARMTLPQNLYTTFICKSDLRNLLHFCSLRSDGHAQWEIRQYSDVILHQIIKEYFPWTYEVYNE